MQFHCKTKTLQAEKQQLEKEKQDREDAVKQREKQLEDRLEVCRSQMETVRFRVQIVFPKREIVLPLDVYPWTTYARLESRIGKHPHSQTALNAHGPFRLCKASDGDRLAALSARERGPRRRRAAPLLRFFIFFINSIRVFLFYFLLCFVTFALRLFSSYVFTPTRLRIRKLKFTIYTFDDIWFWCFSLIQ